MSYMPLFAGFGNSGWMSASVSFYSNGMSVSMVLASNVYPGWHVLLL